jgi:hypothetical protein
VSGATVSATNLATEFKRAVTTTGAGLYNFVQLPVGAYSLRVEAEGFQPREQNGIELSVGRIATIDLVLAVGEQRQEVTVTADAPLLETTRTQTSSVVNERAVADLPINGRNFLEFALLTPGVNIDPRGGDISFGGQRGTANSLLVDGGDSNNLFFGQSSGRAGTRNPFSFSQDAVQEFQVNTNSYAAEIGRAGGGIINVITKSGTNDLHGTAFWFFRDKSMNANTSINNSRGIVRQPYHYNQFGGNAGGPIVRDKAFFFFNYEGQRNKNPNPVFLVVAPPNDPLSQQGAQELQPFLQPYTRNFDNDIFTAKGDFYLRPGHNLTVRYNAHRFNGKNLENSGSSSAMEHTGDSNASTDNLTASYSGVIGTSGVLESRFSYLRDDEPGEANADGPEATISQGGRTVLSIGRNNFSPRFTNTDRYQFVNSLSWITGAHTLKFGADLNFERIANFFPGLFSGSYAFASYADWATKTPFSFTQAFAGEGTDGPTTYPNISEYAFFAQDSWRATQKFTLNFGFRYDLQDHADPFVPNPNPGLAELGLSTSRMNLDTNNIAGRIGVVWSFSDRIVFRSGYGAYYARTPAIITGTAHSQNGIQVRTFELRQNLPTYPNVLSTPPSAAGAPPNIFVFSPGYEQPQTHQWSANIEFALPYDSAFTIGYLGVRALDLGRTRDINLFPAVPVQGQFDDGRPAVYFRHPGTGGPARPNPNFGRISLFDSDADSTYHGGFIQFRKRYSAGVQVLASYTWAKVIDSNPTQVSVVVPFDDGLNVQNTLLPNEDHGLGAADLRQRLVGNAVWDINYGRSLENPVARALLSGYQFSTIVSLQTGLALTAGVGTDLNNNSQFFGTVDRPPFIGRGTVEGPGLATVDLRFSRYIPLSGERARLQLVFEAFNAFNRANFSAINQQQYTFTAATATFRPNPAFGSYTNSAAPRILQLAAKISF